MNKVNNKINNNLFESIKHIDEYGNEFWYARELMNVLQYKKWQNFYKILQKSIIACNNSNIFINYQFTEVSKPIIGGKGNIQYVIDYKLSRYACYLIAQNADPRKEVVALAQTYFAVQTRKQELIEKDYENMSEIEKRFYQRNLTKKVNYSLNQTANDIAKRKGLRYREDILDNMSSDELIANLFRISQTNQKLINDNIKGETNADIAHFLVGKNVRETIIKNGGTLPENLKTPDKSLKEIDWNKK